MPHRNRKIRNREIRRKENERMSVRPDITTLSIEMANLSITKYPTSPESSPEVIDDCPICYDKMRQPRNKIRMEHCCKHTFHRACLQKWANGQRSMDRKCTCPMCRDEWPVEFVEQLFKGCKGKDVISLQYECSCNEDTYVDFLSPNLLQGLSESQKNGLRDIIKRIQGYHEGETQPLLILFMCPEHPLNIDPEESSADRQYEVMKMLLDWALYHVKRRKRPTSHSKFGLLPRPSNYDHFGPDTFFDNVSEP
ncbi:hypothetical protein BTUL_0011g00720 [Botrytis tulipae]|uniref:RING-type domain-containing protein n=1 Tax=Botrytis tulipae TaxID=87230 RepID=A0A4Z1F1P2_9HELO|nr:hypothetical protein BTUL_0011g00720 [Botrytis tulipae]